MRIRLFGFFAYAVLGGTTALGQGTAPRGVPASLPTPAVYQAPANPPSGPDMGMQPTPSGQAARQPTAEEKRKEELEALKRTHAGPEDRFWVGASFLYWSIRDLPAPPTLITANGQPVFGGQEIGLGNFRGMKLDAGIWLNECHTWGLEGSAFLLEQRSLNQQFTGDGLGRAFNNVVAGQVATGLPQIYPVNSAAVSVDSQLGGFELNVVRNLRYDECWSFGALFGFRYIDLEESLAINSTTTGVPGLTFLGVPGQTSISLFDSIQTRNQVYAGQIGGRVEYQRGILVIGAMGKVAFGPNVQTNNILGQTTASPGVGGVTVAQGGLLAAPPVPGTGTDTSSNYGQSSTDWFVVAPEFGIQIGLQLTSGIRTYIGYNYLFINSVSRPTSQIDTNVNPARLPSQPNFGLGGGSSVPALTQRQDNFFVHGISFGVELKF